VVWAAWEDAEGKLRRKRSQRAQGSLCSRVRQNAVFTATRTAAQPEQTSRAKDARFDRLTAGKHAKAGSAPLPEEIHHQDTKAPRGRSCIRFVP